MIYHTALNIACVLFLIQFMATVQGRCTYSKSGNDLICDCSGHNLNRVPKSISRNTTILNLSKSNIAFLQKHSFIWLIHLRSLILTSSNIAFIESEAFVGLISLTSLDLSSNFLEISTLPPDVFKPISNLTYLDLTSNFQESRSYPEHTFNYLTYLQTLRISGYDSAVFGVRFRNLKQLETFVLDPCTITQLNNDTFLNLAQSPVTTLRIKCRIKSVDQKSLAPFNKLDSLSIVDNNFIRISDLATVLSPLKGKKLTEIILSGNHQTRTGTDVLGPENFKFIGDVCVKKLSISHNQIAILKTGSISVMRYKNCLQTLDLSKNCIYGQIGTALELRLLSNLRAIDISEQNPLHAMRPIDEQNYNTFPNIGDHNLTTSIISFPLPPQLKRIQARWIGLRSSPLTNIHVINGHSMTHFDMSYTNFSACDGSFTGMENLQFFGMSGFICEKLNPNLLTEFTNLRTLSSSDASLGIGLRHDVNGEFLKGLYYLNNIDISGNGLNSLHVSFFESQYNSLSSLILSRNFLDDIPIQISRFENLTSLDLRNNRIYYLKEKTTNELDELYKRSGKRLHLYLDQNLFECNCNSVRFLKWLYETSIYLDNGRNYSCLDMDGSHKTTFYAFQNINSIIMKCEDQDWLIASACLAFIMTLFIIISSLGYKYRITIHYWYLMVRRRYRLYSKLVESQDYKYHAFVAYHHDNYSWVCGPLITYLENEKQLKLCIHDRDFALGQYIADNIFDAISDSRKVILVVNKSFFESNWCEYELDMARMRMFRENNNILILVLMEDISTKEMPESLLQIWSKITCLEADDTVTTNQVDNYDTLFWKRLYEAVEV